ncbi:tripartite tricarboxylate transporter permease [Arthrobacter sp. NPDC089319]|uniref:tripartite tricarboxylate transporter permease n=1 Tax=Arthrobacter sp. NPDC089319 TaxID=3155915 RepID=UPI00342F3746
MDFLQPMLDGFQLVIQPSNLMFCLIGVLIGMFIGVLPGLGPVATISILLPITYTIDPVPAVIMLAGIFYGAQYGGTITSVLLRLPGETTSVVTVLDGYQMAKQGRAGSALGIAAIGSFIGGTAALLGLTFLAPVVSSFALDFGPPEYAVLALLGILLVSTLGTGSVVKCLVMACIGLFLATVGLDPVSGDGRFTGGFSQLGDGIDFVPLAMGVFGLGEILYNLEQRAHGSATMMKFSNAYISMKDWAESKWAVLRGTVLGFLIGILPGGGAALSSMLSYAVEKKVAKNPKRFGRGAIEGVAGPETANNAAATSSFIPLLTLGIPANATMAVIYGALLIQGIAPGPQLISEHPDVFWGVINSMWIGNVFLLILSVPLIGIFVRLLRVRGTVLAPITVTVTMIGVFTVNNSLFDMWLVLLFGVIGYLMKKAGYEPGPLVLAFVLGSMLEVATRQSLLMFDGNVAGFVGRPISGVLLAAMVLTVALLPVLKKLRDRRVAIETIVEDGTNVPADAFGPSTTSAPSRTGQPAPTEEKK